MAELPTDQPGYQSRERDTELDLYFTIYLYDCKNFSHFNIDITTNCLVVKVCSVSQRVIGKTQPTPLLSLLRSVDDGVEQDRFPVDAAAADVDGDVPQGSHFPLLVCVSNQHLGLHLFAVVEV